MGWTITDRKGGEALIIRNMIGAFFIAKKAWTSVKIQEGLCQR